MAQSILDIIKTQVVSAATNSNVEIPSTVKDKVISGLSDSILSGIKQTASQTGGIEQLTNLLAGKSSTATNTISDLASKAFSTNVAKNLNLSSGLAGTLVKLIPSIVGKLGSSVAGKVDVGSILGSLIGGGAAAKTTTTNATKGANAAKIAGNILSSVLKNKK